MISLLVCKTNVPGFERKRELGSNRFEARSAIRRVRLLSNDLITGCEFLTNSADLIIDLVQQHQHSADSAAGDRNPHEVDVDGVQSLRRLLLIRHKTVDLQHKTGEPAGDARTTGNTDGQEK